MLEARRLIQVAKLPSFQFYPGDWLKDPALRRCSKSARGVWIDMICFSFECEERGVFATSGVPWPDSDIAAAIGGDTTEVLNGLVELLSKGVCSRNQAGAIFCRRVVRDEMKRRINSENGKKGGNPKLGKSVKPLSNPQVNPMSNRNSTSSSSSSESLCVRETFSETPEVDLSGIEYRPGAYQTFPTGRDEWFNQWWAMLPPKMAVGIDACWLVWQEVVFAFCIEKSVTQRDAIDFIMNRTRMFLQSPKGKREFKRVEAKAFLQNGVFKDDPESWELAKSEASEARNETRRPKIKAVSEMRVNSVGQIIND